MAKGKLGAVDLTTTNDTLLFTATTAGGSGQAFNVRFCNRSINQVKVRLAVGTGGAPASTDWLDYDVPVVAGGILEDTGLIASNGEKVWVRADIANAITVRAHGI